MAIFGNRNKKRIKELQLLLLGDDSEQASNSETELMALANEKCLKIKGFIDRNMEILNSTILPSSFKKSYSSAVSNLKTLAQFEEFIDFPEGHPKERLKQLNDNEMQLLQKMIIRVLDKSCEMISSLPINDKDNAHKVFCNLFCEVQSRLDPSQIAFINNGCKKRITEAVSNRRDVFTQKRYVINAPASQSGSDDPLLEDAIRIVTETGSASISYIQRQLRTGYARAARLVDQMEQRRIVGKYDGTNSRKILISYDEWLKRSAIKDEDSVLINAKMEEEELLSIYEAICEKPDEEKVFSLTGITTEYSRDGYFFGKLENCIVPKSKDEDRLTFVNTLIKYASSKTAKILLLDEGMSFVAYNGVPHLIEQVFTDTRKAVGLFRWLRNVMETRQSMFLSYSSRDINEYNKVSAEKIPHLVIIVYEYYTIKSFAGLDEELIPLLLNGKRFGIHTVLFSNFAINNLSMGAKADLIKSNDANELMAVFDENSKKDNSIGIDQIDYEIDGYQFEQFCGDLLKKNGFSKIKVTQSSSDYGADVIAYKDDVKYAIQCKKYSSPVGISAVQEVIASKSVYDCHVAVVLTNNSFTNSAITLAEKNGVLLWGRDKLIAMMNHPTTF